MRNRIVYQNDINYTQARLQIFVDILEKYKFVYSWEMSLRIFFSAQDYGYISFQYRLLNINPYNDQDNSTYTWDFTRTYCQLRFLITNLLRRIISISALKQRLEARQIF